MSTRRRLLVQPNRRRRTTQDDPDDYDDSPSTPPPDYDDLPPYQPLELPLNADAAHALSEVAANQSIFRTYDTNLKKSAELLRETVGSINDLYSDRKAELQTVTERRQNRGGDQPSKVEVEIDKAVTKLASEVPSLTKTVEQKARLNIDMQIDLEDHREVLQATAQRIVVARLEENRRQQQRDIERQERESARAQRAEARRQARGNARSESDGDAEEDEDDDENNNNYNNDNDTPPASAVQQMQLARDARAADYAQMDAHRKYGLNNDYIMFKKLWHDAEYPDGDVPLPDASAWFSAATGEPAPYGPNGTSGANGGAGGADDGDDDLIVAREVISFKCPLMLITMTDPFKSTLCNHTFERRGIIEYLQTGPKKCPQTGCDRTISIPDLVPDKVMRRRIERAEKMDKRRNEAAATSDIDADEIEVDAASSDPLNGSSNTRSQAESQAMAFKKERQGRQG